jgi:hypothetical protein
MIWRRIPTYITPVNDNCIHNFIALPRQMLHFTVAAAVPRPLLVTSRQAVGAKNNMGSHNYYFYGYILYCLEFAPTHTQENIIIADPVNDQLHACIEAILPGQAFPPNGVNDWTMIKREDTLIREGGSDIVGIARPKGGC